MKAIDLWPLVSLLIFGSSNAAKILFFFQVSTYSHRVAVWPLVEALADRGHNVTFHTIFHPKHPNPKVREFFPSSIEAKVNAKVEESHNLLGSLLNERIKKGKIGTQLLALGLPVAGLELCTEFLKAPETEQFLTTETFDLVIIDALFNECGFGLAHRFGAKTIIFGTTHPFVWTQEAFGVIQDTSVFTEPHVSFPMPISFIEKVISTLIVPGFYYLKTWFYYPRLDELFRTRFNDPNIPRIEDLERQTSLVLYNSHFSEFEAQSLPPMFIPIGGLHCAWAQGKTFKPIPKDIAKFIENAGETGFIYVSFGGEIKLAPTPEAFQEIFYRAFANIKMPVLWKWEGPRPEKMPPNVYTAEWMPQQEILAAKYCKLFITHGGLLGIHEAVSSGVPMLALPIFAEQDYNSYRLERTRRGKRLEPSTLTLEEFEESIREILTNPTYKQNVDEVSKRFKDRPQTPLETAIFWTEYVLRHNDTSSLRPTFALNQFWFQRRLLDVWAFILGIILIFVYLFYFIIKKIISKCFFSSVLSSVAGANPKKKTPKVKKS